jgi:hypothetical protein
LGGGVVGSHQDGLGILDRHGLNRITKDASGFGHYLLGRMVHRGDEVIGEFVLLESAQGLLHRAQLIGHRDLDV